MTLDTALRELDVPAHRPGFFGDLRHELGRGATGAARLRPRLLLVAAAAAVVAGALAFTLTRGSDVASAAQVRAAVERALASSGSISGVFINSESGSGPYPGLRWRFTASSNGAFRIDFGKPVNAQRFYDPRTNVESNSDGLYFVRRTGLAPGPPDSGPADFTLQRGLGAVVAALAAAGDPKVAQITYGGRPAWSLTTPTGNAGEQRRITVDRETGVPVRSQVLRDGLVTAEWRIEGLRVSSTVKAIEPLEPRPGQQTNAFDAGFRRVSLGEARKLARYAPLVPRYVPTGFKLAAVAFAARSRATGEEDGGNPPSRDVVSFLFRRGFDEIVVTSRRTGPSTADWRDPLQVSTAVSSTPKRVRFTGGALEGQSGQLVLEPDALPHIWAVGAKLVVTVAGTVDGADLLKVANSLR